MKSQDHKLECLPTPKSLLIGADKNHTIKPN